MGKKRKLEEIDSKSKQKQIEEKQDQTEKEINEEKQDQFDEIFGFQSLGVKEELESEIDSQIAPKWMRNRKSINDKVTIPLETAQESFQLSPLIIENLKKLNIEELFPVQTEVIPHILNQPIYGRDICVCAPTGSGKTLTYVIPVIQVFIIQKKSENFKF